MNRLQKKCLLASSSLHGFALLLLVFGSAFFVAKEKPHTFSKLQFVPSKFVESALAGGGGNPNVARTDDVQKGLPTAPVQPPASPTPVPPTPQPERIQPPPSKPEPVKPEPTPKREAPKPVETAKIKPADKPVPVKPRIDLSELKPIDRTATDKRKAQKEAEALAARLKFNSLRAS